MVAFPPPPVTFPATRLVSRRSRRPSGLRKTKSRVNSLAHRTTWLRSDLLRSAPKLNEFKLFVLESTVPLGFCCGGFSSTAGYVPGNEARQNSEEFASGVALIWLIISKERCSFLSEQLVSPCGVTSKPFGFGSRRFRQRLSAPSVLERLRHHIRSTSRCRSKCP